VYRIITRPKPKVRFLPQAWNYSIGAGYPLLLSAPWRWLQTNVVAALKRNGFRRRAIAHWSVIGSSVPAGGFRNSTLALPPDGRLPPAPNFCRLPGRYPEFHWRKQACGSGATQNP
jgi:hypothetical protein